MGGVQASTNDINEASQSKDMIDNNEDEENNPYCRKKRKHTSPVWIDFKQITLPDGKMKAECIHCKHRLSITTSGCTSSLNRHSAGCVRRQMNTTGQKNISIITSISESEIVSAVQNFKYDQAKIREIISHMIIIHELPFVFAEYELFNLLMKSAFPYFQKVSRATAKKDCITYEIEKKKLMAALKDVNRVSLTTNLWRYDQKVSYMVVICHYMNSSMSHHLVQEDWKKVHLVCAFLEEFNEVTHIISAVFDIGNKMKLIEWCFLEIYSEVDAIEHIIIVHETLRLLYSEYVEVHRTDIVEKDVQEQVKSELEVYLEEGVVFCEDDHEFDALSWC
ncbi:hypothetical protein ZIOFF_023456 [Zingiber officinale]|uniref:BED-type domain-containing protein n=1 Tax=Zingiber officinale TaxID=94328 RepID=A0A8J5GWS7_ZINOF|nr:hypothetical protein ZIOFF_023456 [Zingiber officinale]